ncbi:MAG TPA: hypothetical protein VIQ30_22785 [Pseudonocardia sp.]
MALRSIYPGTRAVIDHIVDRHPDIDDDEFLLAWVDDDRRIICQACDGSPTE